MLTTKINDSLKGLPLPLQQQISRYISATNFSACFSEPQVKTLLNYYNHCANPIESLCRDLIPLAQTYSLAPISNFHVGAVALGSSNKIYLGANMEFIGQHLGQTVHAEQSVITNAWRHRETSITKLAISAPPCGHCRQFINELENASNIDIYLPNTPVIGFETLLPRSFGPKDLGITQYLMSSEPQAFKSVVDDPIINAAIEAASNSYSPFSNSPSGIALVTASGIYQGSYAENCAYNPSLSPLQGALISLHLSGEHTSNITRVVLAETSDSAISQAQATANLLSSIVDITLETVYI